MTLLSPLAPATTPAEIEQSEIRQVSKKQLAWTIPLICVCSAFLPIRHLLWDTVHTDRPFWGWVTAVVYTFVVVFGPLAMARYVFPDHTHAPSELVGYTLFFGTRLAFSKQAVGIGALLNFFLHCTYGPKTNKPATYAKWLMPPFYLVGAVIYSGLVKGAALIIILSTLMLYAIFALSYILAADKPLDKSKRADYNMAEHFGDGYYFAFYLYFVGASGNALGVVLVVARSAGPVAQSLALQIMSILILALAQKVAIRSSDTTRFTVLMLTVYLSVDTMQTFLFLGEASMNSSTFWQMIFIGEVSSTFKNCGMLDMLSWLFRLRKTFPYHDIQTIKKMKAKALVDSMSEVLSGICAFSIFAVEKTARENSIGVQYHVTAKNATGDIIAEYQSTRCMATCVGWTVDDLVPPPQDLQSRVELLFLFATITAIRLLCLTIEYIVLSMIQTRYKDHLSANDDSQDDDSVVADHIEAIAQHALALDSVEVELGARLVNFLNHINPFKQKQTEETQQAALEAAAAAAALDEAEQGTVLNPLKPVATYVEEARSSKAMLEAEAAQLALEEAEQAKKEAESKATAAAAVEKERNNMEEEETEGAETARRLEKEAKETAEELRKAEDAEKEARRRSTVAREAVAAALAAEEAAKKKEKEEEEEGGEEEDETPNCQTSLALVTQQAGHVIDSAASVLESVPLPFLFAAFYLAVNACLFGLKAMAWTPTNSKVTMEIIE